MSLVTSLRDPTLLAKISFDTEFGMALRQCLRNSSRVRGLLHLVQTEQATCIESASCSSAVLRYRDSYPGDSTLRPSLNCNLFSSLLNRGFHVSASARQEITVASMGESITEGTISAILKKAGEKVEEDEPIMQIETDKVTIDVRAPQAGVLEHLLVSPTALWASLAPVLIPISSNSVSPLQVNLQ